MVCFAWSKQINIMFVIDAHIYICHSFLFTVKTEISKPNCNTVFKSDLKNNHSSLIPIQYQYKDTDLLYFIVV